MPKAQEVEAADDQLLTLDLGTASDSALILAMNAITIEVWRRLMMQ